MFLIHNLKKKCSTLSRVLFVGAKAAYGLSWAAVGVFAILDIRTIIYKSRHIDLYRKKQNSQVDDVTNGRGKNDFAKKPENRKQEIKPVEDLVGDAIVDYLTDPFLDMTISERAKNLREYVTVIRQQEKMISENEAIQLLLNG